MRLCMLFGFLGSGKTTLARRILEHQQGRTPIAVIVNEFGDVGIDGTILEGNAIDLIELTSGCLCCTLKGPLLSAVEEIGTRSKAQYLIIEATGIAEPKEMVEIFADPKLQGRYDIGPLVTVVELGEFHQAAGAARGFLCRANRTFGHCGSQQDRHLLHGQLAGGAARGRGIEPGSHDILHRAVRHRGRRPAGRRLEPAGGESGRGTVARAGT